MTKSKSEFERIVEMVSPRERMDMVQLGLNPFALEDIKHFRKIQGDSFPGKLKFWKRFSLGFSFIFKNVILNELEVEVLRNLNKKNVSKDEPEGRPHILTEPMDVETYLRKPVDLNKLKEVLQSAKRSGTPQYKDSIIESLKKREEQEQELKIAKVEEVKVPVEQFIPGVVPVVFENKDLLNVGKEAAKTSTTKVFTPKEKVAGRGKRVTVNVSKTQRQVSKTKRKK